MAVTREKFLQLLAEMKEDTFKGSGKYENV